ncbi:mechanosensitive ion channel [Chromobacterium sp. Beijing]|nr:mechanosensitive ion channel [Chromobacterium sp. Beijing]
MESAIGVLCVFIAFYLARFAFKQFFDHNPERYERFLPYVGFRLVLPVAAQALVMLSRSAWVHLLHERAMVLHLLSAMLFWLTLIRLCCAVVRQALPKGRFERHTEHFLATVLWLGFVSWAIGFDMVVIEWLESMSFSVGKSRLNMLTILNGLLWVSIIVVVALWASRLIESRLMNLKHLDPSLRIVFAKLTRTGLLIAAVLIALPVVGIDLTVLSVFGGAVGIGLGFGLQKIASNFVSGFIILLDHSIRIGDRLMVENRVGYVTKMTSRYVVLKGADGTEALIPNDSLMSNTVVNQSYSDKSMWTSLPVSVAYGTDLDKALALLQQAADHPRVQKDPAPRGFVTLFADSSINLELGFWVADPENGFMGLKSDLNMAIWRLFQQHGIQMPFPQREIRILNDKPQD